MTTPTYVSPCGRVTLYLGRCEDILPILSSIDACVTDPPYGLSFMGKHWDYNVPSTSTWSLVLASLKPGAHLLSFSGTRTQHRIAVAIEDAGFDIRDIIMWIYGSGFPKSLDVSKAIDKAAGAEREVVGKNTNVVGRKDGGVWGDGIERPWKDRVRSGEYDNTAITAPATPEAQQWSGWGTALKPATEPITVARKPFPGTVASNVLAHGTGALNIDGCRVPSETITGWGGAAAGGNTWNNENCGLSKSGDSRPVLGRWPANVIHDGSDEVVSLFPGDGDKSAARYFYCPKASKHDRDEGCESLDKKVNADWPQSLDGNDACAAAPRHNNHPTVKPTDLMRYLCRLVTPPGGLILDPFMGSGSTGKAAILEGFRFIGIEQDADSFATSVARIEHALKATVQTTLPL